MDIQIWQMIIPAAATILGSVSTYGVEHFREKSRIKQRKLERSENKRNNQATKQKDAVQSFLEKLRNAQNQMSSPELNEWIETYPGHSILCEQGQRARNTFQRNLIKIWETMDLELTNSELREASKNLGKFLSKEFPSTSFMFDTITNQKDENREEFEALISKLRETTANINQKYLER